MVNHHGAAMNFFADILRNLSRFKRIFPAFSILPVSEKHCRTREPGAQSNRTGRDHVIDLWRGLALINMAWVHLVGNQIGAGSTLEAWIGEHLRFAAGAFVFIAGLSVAKVFGKALDRGGLEGRAARAWLFRRALLLLVIDRALAVAMGIISRWRMFLPGGEDPQAPLWPLAVFGEAGVTGGLLCLYALLLGFTPALAAIKRRCGISIVIALSITLYIAAQYADRIFHWPPWTFPVAFWQPFFVAGFLSTPVFLRIREGSTGRMAMWAAVSTVAFFALLVARRYGTVTGWDFTKVPLRPAELLRYAITIQFVFAWSMLAYEHVPVLRRMAGCFCLCGRYSLLVYSAHLFIEVPIVEFALTIGMSPAGASMLLVLDAAALVLVAAAQRVGQRAAMPGIVRAGARLWLPRPAIVAIACVLASAQSLRAIQILSPSVLQLQAIVDEPFDPNAEASDSVEPASDDEINPEPFEIPDEAPIPESPIAETLDA